MQERVLFEYAVLRVVPRVEREEFINVGVILLCAKQKFLGVRYLLDETKLKTLDKDLDLDELGRNLKALEQICLGGNLAGPIGLLDMASRFRWLTATRSTIIQSSKVHPGFCLNADEKLNKLFKQMVS
jgi:hypothetical protein